MVEQPRKIDPLKTTGTESGVRWGSIGKVVGVLVAISVITVVGLYVYATVTTGAVVGAANDFLINIEDGKLSEAYASTAGNFKGNQTEERFKKEITQLDAKGFALSSWRSRLFNDKDVLNVNIDVGKKKPLRGTMVLTQSGGDWKVSMFAEDRRLYAGPGAWFETPPNSAEIIVMAKNTIGLLSDALNAGDFSQLYETMAPTYTVRNKLISLNNQFKPFLNAKIDLSETKGIDPTIDSEPKIVELRRSGAAGDLSEASVGPSGDVLSRARATAGSGTTHYRGSSGSFYLVLQGNFSTDNGTIQFTFTYHYEHPEWLIHSMVVKHPNLKK